MNGLRLFYSYCHKDEEYRQDLEKWLSTLRDQGLISEWHDRHLLAGENFTDEIKKKLKEADIVLLLLSQDYIASRSCMEEMSYAISVVDEKRIIPIILKNCTWKETECKSILALPRDGKPIENWNSSNEAWFNIHDGIKSIVEHLMRSFDIKKEFLAEIQQVEFVKQGKKVTNLNDIFVFPQLTKDTDAFTKEIVDADYFLSKAENSILIKGREFSGKSALLRWLFLKFRENYFPIILDGDAIFKTLNFEDHIKAQFHKQLTGDFDLWKKKDSKIAIIDNFHHKISGNIMNYLEENFAMRIIGMEDEEYLIYYKDDPVFASYSIVSIGRFTLSKQEELIRNWVNLDANENVISDVDLLIDKLEDKVNNIITSNHIVPRFPFFILSILQSLEVFMPRDLSITAYGHCYQALITAQLIKKNIQPDQIDSCFNYLKELACDIYKTTKNNRIYQKGDYGNFKQMYTQNYFIPDAVINRIEDNEYPVLNKENENVAFEYSYIYYFFLGMYLAGNEDRPLLDEISENIHLKQNAFTLIFTVHHAQSKALLENILLHCICSFDTVKPAELSTDETRFMNSLISELPKSIISNKDTAENRRTARDKQDALRSENDDTESGDDQDVSIIEINKAMRIIEVLGQILKNRAGSFEKKAVLSILENTIDLGLRVLSLFLGEFTKPEFENWLVTMLEEAEKEQERRDIKRFDDKSRIQFVEKTIQFFGYMVTNGMIGKISASVGSDKLIDPLKLLAEEKKTPAYEMIEFLVELSQKGIDADSFKKIYKNFDKTKNHWAKRTLSFYVQNYLNTHRVDHKDRARVFKALNIKYLPNK